MSWLKAKGVTLKQLYTIYQKGNMEYFQELTKYDLNYFNDQCYLCLKKSHFLDRSGITQEQLQTIYKIIKQKRTKIYRLEAAQYKKPKSNAQKQSTIEVQTIKKSVKQCFSSIWNKVRQLRKKESQQRADKEDEEETEFLTNKNSKGIMKKVNETKG